MVPFVTPMIMNSPSDDHVTRIYSVPRLSVGNDTKPSVEVGSLFTPLVTTSSNSHVEVTVTAPLLFPGQILGSTEIRRGQIEKITLNKSLSGENVEHSNKGDQNIFCTQTICRK
jgi:hypothetical protein